LPFKKHQGHFRQDWGVDQHRGKKKKQQDTKPYPQGTFSEGGEREWLKRKKASWKKDEGEWSPLGTKNKENKNGFQKKLMARKKSGSTMKGEGTWIEARGRSGKNKGRGAQSPASPGTVENLVDQTRKGKAAGDAVKGGHGEAHGTDPSKNEP